MNRTDPAAAAEPGGEAHPAASGGEPVSVEPGTCSAVAAALQHEPCSSAVTPAGDAAVKPSDESYFDVALLACEPLPASGQRAERGQVDEEQGEEGLKCFEQRTAPLEGSWLPFVVVECDCCVVL